MAAERAGMSDLIVSPTSPPCLMDTIENAGKMRDVMSAAAALCCAPQGLLSLSPLIFLGLLSHPLRAAAIIGLHREGLQEKMFGRFIRLNIVSLGDDETNQSPSECLGCEELWWKLMVDSFKLLLRQPESLLCFPGTV